MFDNYYPNRKDWRKPYKGCKSIDRTCRNHGSCPYCKNNRLFRNKREYLKLLNQLHELDKLPTMRGKW
jgi:hypothetical protein